MADIFPTWGYKSDGSAQIFNLKEGEDLPDGWDVRMEPWNHPNTRHLYPNTLRLHNRAAELTPAELHVTDDLTTTQGPGHGSKKRGRPPNASKPQKFDEQPGAELASELRDE